VELTHSATRGFCFPRAKCGDRSFTRVIVDRSNRKHLIMLGDMVAGFNCHLAVTSWRQCATLAYLLSCRYQRSFSQLKFWHTGCQSRCSYLNDTMLVLSAWVPFSVRLRDRTSAAGSAHRLHRVLLIDLISFMVAISTVLFIYPKPAVSKAGCQSRADINRTCLGFRYIFARKSLLALLLLVSLFDLPMTLVIPSIHQ